MNRFYKIVMILMLFFVLSGCADNHSSDVCECSDLQLDVDYNHFFLNDRTVGYTGKCEQKDKTGVLMFEKNFTKGKMEGEMIIYYPNGKIKSIKHYKKNVQHGMQYDFSEYGDTIIKASFDRGEQDSLYYSK